jgi:hypothetical protein
MANSVLCHLDVTSFLIYDYRVDIKVAKCKNHKRKCMKYKKDRTKIEEI